ncbi:hypothetical protein AB1N83_014317, partial [Pleurotus pulmonarius]
MMTSPPDLSSLSLNSHPQQRLHDSYDYEASPAREQYFATTSPRNIAAQSHFSALTMGQSPLNAKPARGALPTQWLDSSPDNRSLSPNNNSDFFICWWLATNGTSQPPD